jgi:hypothetical protein
MSSRLNAPTILIPGKSYPHPFVRWLGGPQKRSWKSGKKKIHAPHGDSNSDPSVFRSVSIRYTACTITARHIKTELRTGLWDPNKGIGFVSGKGAVRRTWKQYRYLLTSFTARWAGTVFTQNRRHQSLGCQNKFAGCFTAATSVPGQLLLSTAASNWLLCFMWTKQRTWSPDCIGGLQSQLSLWSWNGHNSRILIQPKVHYNVPPSFSALCYSRVQSLYPEPTSLSTEDWSVNGSRTEGKVCEHK